MMPVKGGRLFDWMQDNYGPERVLMKSRSEGLTWKETAQAIGWRYKRTPSVDACRQKMVEIRKREPSDDAEVEKRWRAMSEAWADLLEEHLDNSEVLITLAEAMREGRATLGRRGRVPRKRD